jgi:EAL domain-containing protein (putative c-di-GMP-specific phosphodiesterase class I)
VVEAVLKLAKGLDLAAVVEGVESPQQYATLQSMGCDAAQGYGICRPLDLDAFGDWLDAYGRSEVARLQSPLKQSGLI